MHGTCVNESVDRSFELVREEGVTDSDRRVADASHGYVLCLVRSRQACAGDPMYGVYANYSDYMGYPWLSEIASKCGHPACTVTVTPPALGTCEGAVVQFRQFRPEISDVGACPRVSPSSPGQEYPEWKHTPASCNTSECTSAISSMTDQTMACWKSGLQVSSTAVSLFARVRAAGCGLCRRGSALVLLCREGAASP